MARAYAYCIGQAPYLPEIDFYHAIKEFGVMAVTGRDVLSGREVRDSLAANYAERLIDVYRARKLSKSMNEWDVAHPAEALAIARAQKEYLEWRVP